MSSTPTKPTRPVPSIGTSTELELAQKELLRILKVAEKQKKRTHARATDRDQSTEFGAGLVMVFRMDDI